MSTNVLDRSVRNRRSAEGRIYPLSGHLLASRGQPRRSEIKEFVRSLRDQQASLSTVHAELLPIYELFHPGAAVWIRHTSMAVTPLIALRSQLETMYAALEDSRRLPLGAGPFLVPLLAALQRGAAHVSQTLHLVSALREQCRLTPGKTLKQQVAVHEALKTLQTDYETVLEELVALSHKAQFQERAYEFAGLLDAPTVS